MAITPSEPDVPLPLTDREQRILDAIGKELAREVPGLDERLSAPPARRAGALDHVLCVLAVFVVLGILLPREWFVLAVLIAAITVPPLLAARFLPGR